jgi:hypothetical protein
MLVYQTIECNGFAYYLHDSLIQGKRYSFVSYSRISMTYGIHLTAIIEIKCANILFLAVVCYVVSLPYSKYQNRRFLLPIGPDTETYKKTREE